MRSLFDFQRLNEDDEQPVPAKKDPDAVANAADAPADGDGAEAATAADGQPLKKKKGRPRKLAASVVRENNERIAGGIQGLDALHTETLKGIQGKQNGRMLRRADDGAEARVLLSRLEERT